MPGHRNPRLLAVALTVLLLASACRSETAAGPGSIDGSDPSAGSNGEALATPDFDDLLVSLLGPTNDLSATLAPLVAIPDIGAPEDADIVVVRHVIRTGQSRIHTNVRLNTRLNVAEVASFYRSSLRQLGRLTRSNSEALTAVIQTPAHGEVEVGVDINTNSENSEFAQASISIDRNAMAEIDLTSQMANHLLIVGQDVPLPTGYEPIYAGADARIEGAMIAIEHVQNFAPPNGRNHEAMQLDLARALVAAGWNYPDSDGSAYDISDRIDDTSLEVIDDTVVVRHVSSRSLADAGLLPVPAPNVSGRSNIVAPADAPPFRVGPLPARELDPITGGWGFFQSVPFGAQEPGEDPAFDEYWVDCRNGDGYACDALFFEGDRDTPYFHFGSTCGGRTATETCHSLLGGEEYPGSGGIRVSEPLHNRLLDLDLAYVSGPTSLPPGENGVLDALWIECGIGGLVESCTELEAEAHPVQQQRYSTYGETCGGRIAYVGHGSCLVVLSDAAARPPAGSGPPGTFAAANDLWRQCAADVEECPAMQNILRDHAAGEPPSSEWHGNARRYLVFAESCGGVYDRPLDHDCTEFEYADWPVVAGVDDLPNPPTGPTIGRL